ncbi:MAG TPA: hypothetical protein VNJ01_06255 [Bacteriovoracaceae bacterium]|nr:hypothetical protein [Bacteriovoracaceae bacterium]
MKLLASILFAALLFTNVARAESQSCSGVLKAQIAAGQTAQKVSIKIEYVFDSLDVNLTYQGTKISGKMDEAGAIYAVSGDWALALALTPYFGFAKPHFQVMAVVFDGVELVKKTGLVSCK